MRTTLYPVICKVDKLVGRTLTFRDANVDDASFILALRTDEEKSRYISATSTDIEAQRSWLQNYAALDNQVYFIIEHQAEAIGTVRLYDAKNESFCWGSWILKDGGPSSAAIESALMVYAYAIDHLGFRSAHFTVSKGNKRVWNFHERFGAIRVHEDDDQYFYKISLTAIEQSRVRYKKFLPDGVFKRLD